jgi:hypothetical protein
MVFVKASIQSISQSSLEEFFSWGRCYDHLRFSSIFGEKNWRFSQKPILGTNFRKTSTSLRAKKRRYFR